MLLLPDIFLTFQKILEQLLLQASQKLDGLEIVTELINVPNKQS